MESSQPDYLCRDVWVVSSEHVVLDSDRFRVTQDKGGCSNTQARQDICHRLIVKHRCNNVVHIKAARSGRMLFRSMATEAREALATVGLFGSPSHLGPGFPCDRS